jgi:hypothetical protein
LICGFLGLTFIYFSLIEILFTKSIVLNIEIFLYNNILYINNF